MPFIGCPVCGKTVDVTNVKFTVNQRICLDDRLYEDVCENIRCPHCKQGITLEIEAPIITQIWVGKKTSRMPRLQRLEWGGRHEPALEYYSEIKQTVYDYNKWKGPAVIYFNIVDGQFWTNATNLIDPKWPRKPTAMDVVIASKDFPSRKIKISIEEVKSMAENVLKEIENNEKRKIEME